jgi:hypothetical protein
MQACPHCNKDNPDQETYCYSCGHILPTGLKALTGIATTRLDNGGYNALEPRRRWGTAYFGHQSKLELTFPESGQKLQMEVHGKVIVGRAHGSPKLEQPNIDLAPFGAIEQGVSRRHLALVLEHETITVMDLGSANHTYLNGQRLIPYEPRILRDSDELRLGRLVIRTAFI